MLKSSRIQFEVLLNNWESFDKAVKLSEKALSNNELRKYCSLSQLVHEHFFKFTKTAEKPENVDHLELVVMSDFPSLETSVQKFIEEINLLVELSISSVYKMKSAIDYEIHSTKIKDRETKGPYE